MKKLPLIKSAMHPFPYTVEAEDSLENADKLLKEHDIRHLPVTENGKLIGIISDRDIKHILNPNLGLTPKSPLTVKDVCKMDAYVVDLSARLDSVLLEMAKRHIGSALVVKNDKLVGIFTTTDACKAFGKHLREQNPVGGGGGGIAA